VNIVATLQICLGLVTRGAQSERRGIDISSHSSDTALVRAYRYIYNHQRVQGACTHTTLGTALTDTVLVWACRYIYNHQQCGECKGPVRTWDMAARTVYACETCQPLPSGAVLTEARQKALKGGRQAVEFVSHCASESAATRGPEKMLVAELKAALKVRLAAFGSLSHTGFDSLPLDIDPYSRSKRKVVRETAACAHLGH
jgi:hypothetical protein